MGAAEIITAISSLNSLQLIVILTVVFLVYKSKDFILAIYRKKKGIKGGYSDTITLAIKVAVDKAIRIFEIRRVTIVEAQMVLIDRLSEKCKNILIDDFYELMNLDSKESYKEIRAYANILDVSFKPITWKLRKWVIKNHLTERSEMEFKEYVEETTDEVIEATSASIDKNYFSEDFSINRIQLKKKNLEVSGKELYDTISDTLYELRNVSKKYQVQIRNIEDEE